MSDEDKQNGKLEPRIANVEQAIRLLTQLALRADERMDELKEAQENSERKIAALADAQIRTEEALARLAQAQQRTEEQLVHTDQRLDALIDIVRERLGGQPQG
jgi:chromosome segregation ATPase